MRHSISLCMFAVAMFLTSCGPTENSLRELAKQGQHQKLLQFVLLNYDRPNRLPLLETAVDLLAADENRTGIARAELESLFYLAEGSGVTLAIVRAFNHHGRTFSYVARLCDFHLMKCSKDRSVSSALDDEVCSMLAHSTGAAVDSFFFYHVAAASLKGDYIAAAKAGNAFLRLETDRMPIIATCVNIINSHQHINVKRDSLQGELSRLREKASNYESSLADCNFSTLNAWVVANVGENMYEVALPQWTYWGQLPSDRHAVFITTETQFTTTGWFTKTVQRLSNYPVQLTNGMYSEWPVFREAGSAEQLICVAAREGLSSTRRDINASENRLNGLSGEKSRLELQLETLVSCFPSKNE